MRAYCVLFVMSLTALIGCGAEISPSNNNAMVAMAPHDVAFAAVIDAQRAALEVANAAQPVTRDNTKIIYTAQVELRVERLLDATIKFENLVAQSNGYVSSSRQKNEQGNLSSAFWKIRIPSDHYRVFLRDLAQLGQVVQQSSASQEVTEEFIDLEARIKNLQRQETRLETRLERLNQSDEILRVEQEVTRVRTDIERLQGRQRFLHDQTAMSTIDVTISETKTFQAPVTVAEPTFGDSTNEAWMTSRSLLMKAAQGLTRGVIILGPWCVLFGLPLLAIGRKVWRGMFMPRTIA